MQPNTNVGSRLINDEILARRQELERVVTSVEQFQPSSGQFDDEAWFYPGHGNDSTLGVEGPRIPKWRARAW